MVDAVLDTRPLSGKKMVVGRVRGHLHVPCDEGRPPHGLLFSYRWGCTDAGTHEADECAVIEDVEAIMTMVIFYILRQSYRGPLINWMQ